MDFRNKLCVLFVLLALLTISAVSATDASVDNSTLVQNNGGDIPVTTGNDPINFTSLQKDIDSEGYIKLQNDVKHGVDEVNVKNITISNTTVLNGNGHTIDANNQAGIFVVKSGKVLTLSDITLINANNGAISVENGATLSLNNVTFKNNFGPVAGAIYADGATLNLENVIFQKNIGFMVGAVYNSGTSIIIDSVFKENKVLNSINSTVAAAIYQSGGNILRISNSVFTSNEVATATVVTFTTTLISNSKFRNNENSAVASFASADKHIDIEKCIFDENTASEGAAVNIHNSSYTISESNFTNNKAVSGAIMMHNASGILSDCLLENNSASKCGGAIFIDTDSDLNIKSSKFVNNTSPCGRSIYNQGLCNISDTEFKMASTIGVEIYNEGILDLNIKNFTNLKNAIGLVGNVLTLNSNVVMTDEEAKIFVGGIKITKNITIDGRGHTIDARHLGAIFNIFNYTVTLTDVTLANANSDYGAAIFSDGNLTLDGVDLINNTATDYGGAIYNRGNLTVNDVNFINNTASNGGAIYNLADNLVINNSAFDSNYANVGGAITNFNDAITVTDSTFTDNTAVEAGGAIYNDAGENFTINNSNFINNNAELHGGAIYNYDGTNLKINGSKFKNNTANNGGAISSNGLQTTISNSVFENNTAKTYDGGAIYNKGDHSSIVNSTFVDNTAANYAGAIYNDATNFTIADSNIKNSSAKYGGAIMNNYANNLTISNTNFTDNTAVMGGAIMNNRVNNLTITGSNFTNNTATKYGGAIENFKGNNLTFDNSTFINNTAVYGGAVDNSGLNVSIDNSAFINNTATIVGGAIYNDGELAISSSEFENNTPLDGQIYNANIVNFFIETFTDLQSAIDITKGTITLQSDVIMTQEEANKFKDGVTINKNVTIDGMGYTIDANNSGRIFNIAEDANVTLTNVTLINGKAITGGAIYNNGNLTLTDSKLTNNTATDAGGAIYNDGTALSVSDSTFTDNNVSGDSAIGGAIYNNALNCVVDNSTFTDNSAEYGGAIYNSDTGIGLSVSNSTFTNNTATDAGGAIYNVALNCVVDNSTFTDNSAEYGGAIYNGAKDFKVDNSTFTENDAVNGGAIYNEGTALSVSDSTFTNNTADIDNGGAIYNEGTALSVSDSTFINNTAKNIGGAIYNNGVNSSVSDSTFINNTAVNGGAIYIDALNCVVDNSTFTENNATKCAGAIYISQNGNNLSVIDSTFTDNTAKEDAGAIFNYAEDFKVDNSTFTENTATNAGAIYNKVADSYVSNSTFDKNSAVNGGAIYNNGTDLVIEDSSFTNNAATTAGGAIYNDINGVCNISSTEFKNNTPLDDQIHNEHIVNFFIKTFTDLQSVIDITKGDIALASDVVMTDKEAENFVNGITINRDIVIDGNGYTIDANNSGRIFNITNVTVTLKNVTLINGKSAIGGAIYNNGTLTLNDAELTNNTAVFGGAICNINNLTIEDSAFTNNTAISGGAIYNIDNLTVRETEFINNTPEAIFNGNKGIVDLGIDTFTDLQEALDLVNGTLTLDQNITMTSEESNDFKDGITIGKDIVIDGMGYTIDAKQLGRIFNIPDGVTVTLTNVTLANGKADKGGAIYNKGELTLIDTNLISNSANHCGGAIYNLGNDVSIINSSFVDNTAVSEAGAIYNTGSDIVISNSSFVNSKSMNAGAILNYGATNVVISDCNFTTNSASHYFGGAIENLNSVNISIKDSKFTNNSVSDCGGAIYNKGSTNVSVIDSEFNNNKATNYGGAIYNTGSANLTVTGSNFTNNSAFVGGAIFVNDGNVSILSSNFENNTADYYGAIYNEGNTSVEDSKFVNNTNGVIYNGNILDFHIKNFTDLQYALSIIDGKITLQSDVVITNEEAKNFVNGVTIDKDITIDGMGYTIDAKKLGRIFNIIEGNIVTLTNVTLINGNATNGGAIYNKGELILTDSKLTDNEAYNGSAIYNVGEIEVDGSNFTKNTADVGAIYNNGTLTLNNAKLINNAAENGSAIYNLNELDVNGSTFTNNFAKDYGAIYNNGTLTLNNTKLSYNTAKYGGAIYNIANVTVYDSNFTDNKYAVAGGAIYNNGNLTLNGAKLSDNTAENGGAIYNIANVAVYDSNFTDNKYAVAGGAIYNNGNLTLNGAKLSDNTAENGGAIYNIANVAVYDSNFTDNKAVDGGAIYNNGNLTLNCTKLSDNAADNGGAIYSNGTLLLNGTELIDNVAVNGSAIYNANLTFIANSDFNNNSAKNGGAIYNNDELVIINSAFENNNATLGVDIYNDEEAILAAGNNTYTVTENKTNVYNNGTLYAAVVTVLGNQTVRTSYGEVISLTATVTIDGASVSGKNLVFIITGTNINATTINATSLANGTYIANYTIKFHDNRTVSASYDGADLDNITILNATLASSKGNPALNIIVSDIFVDDHLKITITTLDDVTGLMNLTINGTNYTLPIYKGTVEFHFDGLTAGLYNITASYPGDDNYNASSVNASFNVYKILPKFTVDVENIFYGNDATIIINLPSDINGIVSVSVNGTKYDQNIENGFGKLNVANLDAGIYNVSIVYKGNYKYLNNTFNTTFEVFKADADLEVIIDNVTYGEISTITVTLTGANNVPLDGIVNLTIDNSNYSVKVVNGKGILNNITLPAGDYKFNATWSGNKNYNAVSDEGIFKVNKANPAFNVIIDNVNYGEISTITATLNGVKGTPLTEAIKVIVNGTSYTINIINGTGFTTDKLGAGKYNFTASWDGNSNYNKVDVKGSFVVAKINPTLDVNVSDIKVGEDETIKVVLPDDATGIVNITVIDKGNYTINAPKGNVVLSGLEEGNYTVIVNYDGDSNYNPTILNYYKFTVSKTVPIMNMEIGDIVYGEDAIVNITLLPNIASGQIGIYVDGGATPIKYLDIKDGKASGFIYGLDGGSHNITAKYDGNNKYTKAEVSELINVDKAFPTLNVDIKNVVYDNKFIIVANLTGVDKVGLNGQVVVVINNKEYSVEVRNGAGQTEGISLDAGTYYFRANWVGNENYFSSDVNGSFNVAKADASLDVSIADVIYGEVFVIDAKLNGIEQIGLNGFVVVNVDDINYTVQIIDGKGVLEGISLPVDKYDFSAVWEGNLNYNSATDKGSFNVTKSDSVMEVLVNDIKVGEDEIITVIVPADATGNVTVTVNGKNYTEDIVEGIVDITISGLEEGNYTAKVTYNGDRDYDPITEEYEFTVSKTTQIMDVNTTNIVFGQDSIVSIALPSDATGNATIIVDGKEYAVVDIIGGKANKNITGLDAGSHYVVVNYSGDHKYTETTTNNNIIVDKANPTLNINIANINYGEIFTIEANLTGVNDAPLNGVVVVNVNGKDYLVEVKDGKGTLDGIVLPAENYTFAAHWEGNSNYNGEILLGLVFNVAKINSTINASVNDIKVGEDEIITVIVPFDATGNVTVTVNGENYTADIVDGIAITEPISGLGEGDYTVKVTYDGDNNYNPITDEYNFTVSKVSDYNVNVTIPEAIYGSNTTITIDAPEDATGNITVTIDGIDYNATVESGSASVVIPPLSVGIHNVTTTYSGNDKYDPVTKKGMIVVSPADVDLASDDIIMYYQDGSRFVAVLTDCYGNPIADATLVFVINNQKYLRSTDENGSASIALNLVAGTYDASVSYDGSKNYNPASQNITVKVISTIIGQNITKMYLNDTQFFANFTDKQGNPLVNTTVRFNINGVFYERNTNDNGTAKLTINLRPGNYTLTAYNPVSDEEQGFNVVVKTLIVANDLTKYYMNASKFQATIYDKDGSLAVNKTVRFNINGVFYERNTNENGVVSLAITLRPGDYVITTMYGGLEMSNNVHVLPTLITEDLSMHYRDGSKFNATTLDGQGNPLANQTIFFNVNGVFYNKTTGEDGVASLAINLNRGSYIITSMWGKYQIGNTITIRS